jgi:hypothetical protein
MRASERRVGEAFFLPSIENSWEHSLSLPTSMKLVSAISQQLVCLDEYFLATGRPPELQVFFRSIATDIFPRSITVAYVVDERIVGGFSVVARPPIPLLDLIPDAVRRSHSFFREHSEQDLLSVSMLWLKKDFRGYVHSAKLWYCLLSVIRQCGPEFVVYNYSSAEARNWRLYKRAARSINLFDGKLTSGLHGGVDYIPLEHLEGATHFLDGFLNRHNSKTSKDNRAPCCDELYLGGQ